MGFLFAECEENAIDKKGSGVSVIDLRGLTYDEIEKLVSDMGEKKFRARQIYEAVFQKHADDISDITNLSLELRERLSEKYYITKLVIEEKLVSRIDGTVKYLFSLPDGECIESVVMKYNHGYTICISSQVGCAMGCSFCASTIGGKVRNLGAGEIISQIIYAQKDLNIKISNIVMMGIGEPLDNFENVKSFLINVNDSRGMNIGYRHISLSTCGVVPRIYDLAKLNIPITLSVSLHASDDETRSDIMKINKRYPISELLCACKDYQSVTGRRISFEYALIKGVNDSEKAAEKLSVILRDMMSHVNLIPVNAVKENSYTKPSKEAIQKFIKVLEKNKITATVRRELGSDINASCGQLRKKRKEMEMIRDDNSSED